MLTSRFNPHTGTPDVWAFPWNKPLTPIVPQERPRPFTRDEYHQGQAVLIRVKSLSKDLREIFTGRYAHLLNTQGIIAAYKYLIYTLGRSILPRVDAVNSAHTMNADASMRFMSEADTYHGLPSMTDKPLRRFAQDIARQLRDIYEERCEQLLTQYHGDNAILFDRDTQCELYGEIAGMAQAFNVRPMHWTRYLKDKLDTVSAIAGLSRLVNPEWWLSQLKGQRTRWRESLLIAIGKVNRDASPYASKQAIREVRARRLSNLDYLKSCDLENVETGERISLIDKVMASISNPEIRRMELMSTIAGTEKYAAANGDVGMFLTITTPSKYHPTRIVGKDDKKRVQRNHAWAKEAYTPKDAQRYLCGIWSKMRTAFKDSGLSVYGMRVVEPHHDATPHWHMMLFTKPAMRQPVIDIMRKYAMKEDGDERGAAKNRFDCKHLNRGGAAGYIAKYIAKNIDGYALEGERDHETGELLTDSAAAVTAWASTWRIPQFHPIGLPTMGSYRECRRIRSISLTETFDEEVEAVRAAADAGDFMAYMEAQGGANVPREDQTVRVARRVAAELNAYDEEVKKVVGIFASHLGNSRVYETRTTQWRIVSSAVDLEVLTSKSAHGAPRSPVNNCGLGGKKKATNWRDSQAGNAPTASNSLSLRVIDWTDTAAVRAIVARIREETPRVSKAQRSFDPTKGRDVAPSARLTAEERARLPRIEQELLKKDIKAQRWELEALTRGAKISFGDVVIHHPPLMDWQEFYED
ncbi:MULTISPECIES: replication endonuclease [Rahnella]|uniref:Replication endonuclease n=1 Tax=Rahnella laticis TaxID=2787622 RepID=A0ABS0E8T9_9GAMM|nr:MULTISPECIES: replication endonuclease [Rahnella]MBF7980475.1 replication endonuclease [Rahnella laticis]MBF8000265.1 replication endonuclease [Rahnella sp. LAC-M12]